MICVNCGHQQNSGNFCGKCGTKFETTSVQPEVTAMMTEQRTVAPKEPAEPNVFIENTKKKTKIYFKYFMQYLKKPSLVYNHDEIEFSNGLTSIILLAILTGLSFLTLIGNAGYYSTGFFSIFGGMLFFLLALIGLVIISLWLINNFFGPQHSFKSMISLYGGHLSPVLLVGATSLLLMLLKSFTLGSFALIVVFMVSTSLLPLYLISVLLTNKSSSVDPFYGYIIYIVTFSIIVTIFTVVLADSTIGTLLNDFRYFF